MAAPESEWLDSFIDEINDIELQHVYDPIKAHEYYLRNRELKNRRRAAAPALKGRALAKQITSDKRDSAKGAALQKAAEAEVAAIKARLAKLQKALAELVKLAKARSGVTTPTKKQTPAQKAAAEKNKKPLSAAQKADAAKKAKERREKDGDPSLSAEAKQLEAKIKNVREKIAKLKEQIAAAKKKTQSKTAPKAVDTTEGRR